MRAVQRPANERGERITPTMLLDYRTDYEFKAPCCLCACNSFGIGYTECAIYIPLHGNYSGEYVAGCATGICGYLSEYKGIHT